MEKIELKVQTRTDKPADHVRKEGFIPAVVYGHNIKTESLVVPYQDFEKVFKKAGESSIVSLNVEGAKSRDVVIHDVQRHYLNGRFQHIDFYEVSMTEKMKATVPLQFIGVSKAVKESGGILVQILNEVEVECLPSDLPRSIEVDISVLQTFSDMIHVSDLKISDKVKILAGGEEAVVKVDQPRDVEKELATPVVEDVSKVEGAAETPKEGEVPAKEEPDKEKPAKEKPAKEKSET